MQSMAALPVRAARGAAPSGRLAAISAAGSSGASVRPFPGPGAMRGELALARAEKRVIERIFFPDVFNGAADRVIVNNGLLKLEETLVLVESVERLEHCFKALDLFVKHLDNCAGKDINDWHHRKKYYRRLCQQALRFEGGADVVFAIFGNLERFRVAQYFAKETIADLGAKGVHPKLLLRIAELAKLQRGPGDKGVQHAYKAVVDVTTARDTDLDRSVLAVAKAELRTARNAGAQLEAAAAAPGAADQPPPEVAGVQAVTGVAPAAMSEHPMEQAV